MSERTNMDRANGARKHVYNYAQDLGGYGKDLQCAAVDLVADILHLGVLLGWKDGDVLRLAETHFDAERNGIDDE